ncbi:MAG: glutathione peroxidase [Candidatus Hydrogenedentota bacterium]
MRVVVSYLMAACLCALAPGALAAGETASGETAESVLDFTLPDITGEAVELEEYQGDVLLLVNVASECGLTPQYEQLVKLDEVYRSRGLRVLGFPANNFGEQEPGTDKEIRAFCTDKFGVKFDMFSKISVKGDDMHPLYTFLTSKEQHPETGGEITWNFTKFLVNRAGHVSARFEPQVKPDDEAVIAAIEQALNEPAPESSEAAPGEPEASPEGDAG